MIERERWRVVVLTSSTPTTVVIAYRWTLPYPIQTQVSGWQQPSPRQFILTVVTQLLQRFDQVTAPTPRRHSDALPDRLEGRSYIERHAIEPLPPMDVRNVGVGRCYVCSHTTRCPKMRKNTSYWCHLCQVPMCLHPCFTENHTHMKY
ncbi:hypothetical protein Pcinc_001378 [Petrolisthes cinctipes]|uniref:PiggyBac transposable element-derived protein 4 C-terminal zinc-ribbon domain-containing protein n=1 Tax=Petrolisthes cinctipes TaxID=88211 RepID=A0AAE1GLR1_PETCI|nr:hypothetical protein Pcinc_001378 [Petrolisthes cinctipes]